MKGTDFFLSLLASGVLSGSVIAAVLGLLLSRRNEQIKKEVEAQFVRLQDVFRSRRTWKERALSDLLGPLYMQFDRTGRAFNRWNAKNTFLEAKVIRDGNVAIRDLLLKYTHLIPPALLEDAGKLVEHYDRWLEEFEKIRLSEQPDLQKAFVFVGPEGFPFPREAEKRFREIFKAYWKELYEEGA